MGSTCSSVVAVGWCLGLNRLKMYLAANISNPFVAPLLILTELQTGAWFRRGELHALTLDTVRNIDPWSFGADLIVGSLVVGGVLGVLSGTATYFMARAGDDDPVVRRARAPRRGPLRVHEHHRVGVRARQAAGRSALPHRPDRMRASFRRDARRRRLRSGAHAGAARRVRSGVARGDLAVILAAASGVRPARRHRDTAVASRRSPARRSARPRRSSKAMRARTCRTARASCCSSTCFT